MDRSLLLKAASLCKEAAEYLKTAGDKSASEIVDAMVSKGMLDMSERERYESYLKDNPEKLAAAKGVIDALPCRSGAIGEVSTNTSGGGLDPMDNFIYS